MIHNWQDVMDIILPLYFPPWWNYLFYRHYRQSRQKWYGWWVITAAAFLIMYLLTWLTVRHPGVPAVITAAGSTIVALILYWRQRRRKRAPKLAGERAKAIKRKMARNMRQRKVRLPVLQPVPGRA